MDNLYVYVALLVFVLVTFFSLLYISKRPRGKTFDEVLAEKRLAEKLYAPSNSNKNKSKSKKTPPNKKPKQQSNKSQKENKEIIVTSNDEVDSENSDENIETSSNSGSKGHVEFLEAEVIPFDTLKKSNPNSNKVNAPTKRKNSKSPGPGILINKGETTPVKNSPTVKQLNHFDEIIPKDVVELKNQNTKEEIESTNKNTNETKENKTTTPKENRKGKKKEIVENSSADVIVSEMKIEKSTQVTPKQQQQHQVENTVSYNQPTKDKTNKKKKTEFDLVQKLMDEREGINMNFLIPILNKAELSRGEIQILIDFLLNKQQDTITPDPSEWSEGKSDVVQKLKKQLMEKEQALIDEQNANSALQGKLKELRSEINLEKSQLTLALKIQADQLKNKNLELQNLASEMQYLNDKNNVEKQTLNTQIQQLQAKYIQEKKANSQELLQQVQQLTENNNALKTELVAKNAVIMEMQEQFQKHKFQFQEFQETIKNLNENEKKFGEYEHLLRQKDEQKKYLEQELNKTLQLVQDLKTRETEIQIMNERLRADICRKENFEGMFERQQFEFEQLKKQMNEQTKTAHLDDANKVEIRNLQNALDSSRKELNEYRNEANDNKKLVDEFNIQIRELKTTINTLSNKNTELLDDIKILNSVILKNKAVLEEKENRLAQFERQLKEVTDKEAELLRQIQEAKEKNNDIRMKNWKLVEALQKAESNAVKNNKNSVNNFTNGTNTDELILEEQAKWKKQIASALPDFDNQNAADFNLWLKNLVQYLQKKCNESKSSVNITSNNIVEQTDKYQQLLLQNEKLQESLENSRRIMTETDKILTNLETDAEKRESYWQDVVKTKNLEIEKLKSGLSQVQTNNLGQ